jgi:hypothetical protein
MEDSKFDVIVLGTGLTESIVAACVLPWLTFIFPLMLSSALSKWGFKIAHIEI